MPGANPYGRGACRRTRDRVAKISLAELVNLKPGDIIPCDFTGKASVLAEDVPLFKGTYGLIDPKGIVRFEGHPSSLDEQKLEQLLAQYN